MAETYTSIDRPYGDELQRSDDLPYVLGDATSSSSNGSVEEATAKSDGSLADLWIKNSITSINWKPKKVGFMLNGQTGYAEFSNVYISGNITATSGTFGGFTLGSDYIRDAANSFGLASTVTGGDDVRFWAGDTFANRATAPFRVTEAGLVNATNIVLSGSVAISGIANNSSTDISILEKTHNLTFSVTNATTIAWSAGTISLSNGRTFTISAGNTGVMSALTYVYLDTAISSTVLQTTTVYSTAIGANKMLLGSASNGTVTASFVPYGPGVALINGDLIGALTIASANVATSAITTAKIAANAVTAGEIASGAVTSVKSNIALRGWTQTSIFSITGSTQVNWGIGTLTVSDGTSYSIVAGNTGIMAAKTYIYLDIAVSTTAYQTTTTATTAIGDGKILVAIAQNNTTEAVFQVLNSNSNNIDASNIVAGSLTANEIAASTITGAKIAATTITAGNIAALTITGAEIAAGAITAGKIAALSITASEIAANTITAAQIFAGTITTTQIAANTIVAGNIAASTITAAKMSVTDLSAISANIGSITSGSITVTTGANTVAFTPAGVNAIISGPTGTPTFTVTQAGVLYASGAVISGASSFAGSLSGATGTFSGSLSAATGTFAGTLSAVSGTFNSITAGSISGVSISGSTITGSTLTTATSGQRVVLTTSLMELYSTSGQTGLIYGVGSTLFIGSTMSTGTVQINSQTTGYISLNSGNSGISMDTNGITLLYVSASNSINISSSGISLTGIVVINTKVQLPVGTNLY